MTDAGADPRSNLRLSDSERDAAVARLDAAGGEGRLSRSEVLERTAVVRSAVTRADLVEVLRDLPEQEQEQEQAPYARPAYPGRAPSDAAAAAAAAPVFDAPLKPGLGIENPEPPRRGSSSVLIVSIAPFVALVLFFLTASVFGYDYAWLWFLLVPVAGILVYGGGNRGRDRR